MQRFTTHVISMFLLLLVAPVAVVHASALQTSGFDELTIYEVSGATNTISYALDDPELLARRAGTLGAANNDFVGVSDEYYDVFYSDKDGTPNASGAYLSIECRWDHGSPSGGGLNIAGVRLHDAPDVNRWGVIVSSAVSGGDNYVAGSEERAVGPSGAGDLNGNTTMGNTVGTMDRLRVTLGIEFVTLPAGSLASLAFMGLALGLAGYRRLRAVAVAV
jgi:hypothetical protein